MENRRVQDPNAFIDLIKSLDRRISQQETRASGAIVIRSTLTTTDPSTGVSTIIGQLPDGTYGLQQWVNDTTPPVQPSPPLAFNSGNSIEISWDGFDVNGLPQVPDYDRTIVEMSTDGIANWIEVNTLYGNSSVFVSNQPFGETRYFRLVSIDKNGNRSTPSAVDTAVSQSLAETTEIAEALATINSNIEAITISANGRNKNYYSATAPAATGLVDGDIWFETDNGNKISIWNGTTNAWTAAPLGTGAISELNAGLISSGSLSTSVLVAKSVSMDKLTITSTDNLVAEANFASGGKSWELKTGVTINATNGRGGSSSLRFTGSTAIVTSMNTANLLALDSGSWYYGSMYVKSSVALPIGAVKLILRTYTTPLKASPVDVVLATNNVAFSPTAYLLVDGKGQIGANVTGAEILVSVQNSTVAAITDIDFVAVTKAASGKLVVDGSIDGKIITGATLRTNATPNTGVVINGDGITAWNTAGESSFRLDSATGDMVAVGTYQTAMSGNRVKIWDHDGNIAAIDLFADVGIQHGALYSEVVAGTHYTELSHFVSDNGITARITLGDGGHISMMGGAPLVNGTSPLKVGTAVNDRKLSLWGSLGTINGGMDAYQSLNFQRGAQTQGTAGVYTFTFAVPLIAGDRFIIPAADGIAAASVATRNITSTGFEVSYSSPANNSTSVRVLSIWVNG